MGDQTLEDGSPPSRWSPPATPYALTYLPDNLVENWARELKRSADWPHSVRAIRKKIRKVAKDLSEGKGALSRNQTKNRQGDMFAALGGPVARAAGIGNMSRVQELDEDSDDDGDMMDYEHIKPGEDSIIISPVTDVHPRQGRDDSNVYK